MHFCYHFLKLIYTIEISGQVHHLVSPEKFSAFLKIPDVWSFGYILRSESGQDFFGMHQ